MRISISMAILAVFCCKAIAGYTHYFSWKQPPDDAALRACVADMNRLIEARKSILVSPDLPGSRPGFLALGATNVDFNGIGNDAHEPFVFPYVFPNHDSFNFCKTAWKPYDEVVTSCLIVARDHFPPSVLEISSDGSWPDWSSGAKLYSSVFGRRARNPLSGREFDPASLLSVIVILAILLGFFFWQRRVNSRSKAWRRSFE